MRAFVIALVCLLGPANCVHAAEPPKVEVSGGWVGRACRRRNSVYATFTRDSRPKLSNFMVGPKFIFPQRSMPMLIPFVQVLAGGSRFDGGLRGYDPQTNFAIQPGGGVDVGIASKISLRFQADMG